MLSSTCVKNETTVLEGVRHGWWIVLLSFGCFRSDGLGQAADLVVDRGRLAVGMTVETATFAASDCAVVEGCVNGSGLRKIVRFTAAVANIGTDDIAIGNPNDHPELFQYSECHGHFHFRAFALYELVDSAGAVAASTGKRAFCLRDNVQYVPGAGRSHGYNCDNQGITAGWEDIYDKSIDCQFLDITDVPPGFYTLRVTVNAEGLLAESNYENNSASVGINLSGTDCGDIGKPKKPKNPHWKRGHNKSWKDQKKNNGKHKGQGKGKKGKGHEPGEDEDGKKDD